MAVVKRRWKDRLARRLPRIRRDMRQMLIAGIALPNGMLSRMVGAVKGHPATFRLPMMPLAPLLTSWDQRNIVYHECYSIVRRMFPGTLPEIRCASMALLAAAIAREERVVVIGMHSDISTAFYRVLADHGSDFSVIADPPIEPTTGLPYLQLTAMRLGFDRAIDIIPSDADCFVRARQTLAEGRIVCCAPDRYERPDEISGDQPPRLVLEANLFEFCRLMKIAVFYSVPCVAPDGAIDINLSGPFRYNRDDNVEASVAHFMKYVEGIMGIAPDSYLIRRAGRPR